MHTIFLPLFLSFLLLIPLSFFVSFFSPFLSPPFIPKLYYQSALRLFSPPVAFISFPQLLGFPEDFQPSSPLIAYSF
jgi:hypothetical protein